MSPAHHARNISPVPTARVKLCHSKRPVWRMHGVAGKDDPCRKMCPCLMQDESRKTASRWRHERCQVNPLRVDLQRERDRTDWSCQRVSGLTEWLTASHQPGGAVMLRSPNHPGKPPRAWMRKVMRVQCGCEAESENFLPASQPVCLLFFLHTHHCLLINTDRSHPQPQSFVARLW